MSFQDKIRNPSCELCPLHEGAKHVCLMGSGTKRTKIMIIGEAPGEREDESHKAFVGPAGQLLDKLLAEVEIERADVYITNVAKCRPEGNRTPERKEIKACVEAYLWAEWDKVHPEYVLLLGNAALQGVLGRSGITKHRGTPVDFREATVLPAFHPAYALRNPRVLPALKADLQKLRRLIDGVQSPAGKTTVKSIRTPSHLAWLLRKLRDAKEFSFDVETNLNKEDPKHTRYYEYWEEGFRIVSLSFTFEEGTSYVVPLWHDETPWRDPGPVLQHLRPYLERGIRGRDHDAAIPGTSMALASISAHNGKFDSQALGSFGIRVRLTFDTMLAAHMLDENRLKGLKPLSEIELAADGYVIQTEDKKIDYGSLPWRDVAVYNGKDTDYALRLKHQFQKELQDPDNARTARVFVKLMMPASDMLVKVERRGVWIDPERLSQRVGITQRNLARIRGYIAETAGAGAINLNSPQQVAKWLFGDLGLPIIERTGKGAPSTREAVILRLARTHPQVRSLLLYRKWAKYESTYLRPWVERRDKHSRYHTYYKLFGTVTGRLSGDFQQVPRDSFIRSIVGAPPGWKLVAADFSQVELRIAAMLANERAMLAAFAAGIDLHLNTAVGITRKRPDDIEPEERKKAKPVNFGFLYGMGAPKFGSYAFENYGVDFTAEECYAARAAYFEMYPDLLAWHDRQRRLARQYGRVYSPIGRCRHLPDINSNERGVSSESERQAINSPVQSTASDLMLMSMLILEGKLEERSAFIIATVHDEILFQVRDEVLDETCALIKDVMERQVLEAMYKKFGADFTVPIEAEVSYGQHWDKVGMKTWQS